MPDEKLKKINPNPIAYIFSENVFLSQKLYKKLSELKCKTFLFTKKTLVSSYEGKVDNLIDYKDIDEVYDKYSPNYIIKFTSKDQLRDEAEGNLFTKVLSVASETQAKTIFTFPYGLEEDLQKVVTDFIEKSFQSPNLYIGFFYLGEIVYENDSSLENTEFNKFLDNKNWNTQLNEKRVYHPIFLSDLVDEIVSELLSINIYNSQLALVSDPLSLSQIGLNMQIGNLESHEKQQTKKNVYPEVNVKKISPTARTFVKENLNKYFKKLNEKKVIKKTNEMQLEKIDDKTKSKLKDLKDIDKKDSNFVSNYKNKKKVSKNEKTKPKTFTSFWSKLKSIKRPKLGFYKLKRIKSVNRDISFHTWNRLPKFDAEEKASEASDVKDNSNLANDRPNKFRKNKGNFGKLGKKILITLFTVIFVFFVFPTISNSCVKLLNFAATRLIASGKYSASYTLSRFSYDLGELSKKESVFFKNKGFLNSYYDYEFNNAVEQSGISGVNNYLSQALARFGFLLESESNSSEKIKKYSDIALDLENVYQKIGFLEGESEKEKYYKSFYSDLFSIDENDFKNKLYLLSRFFSDSPYYLGQGESKQYALVLLDDKIVRPNGGKIVSIAIVKLFEGAIEAIDLYGTNYLDRKLDGLVETPDSLNRFFGVESWTLSEANWYLDNEKTNEETAWFLDKEIDTSVDMVITINKSTLKYFLNNFGSNRDGNNRVNQNRFVSNDDNIENVDLLENLVGLFPLEKNETNNYLKSLLSAFSKRNIMFYSYSSEYNKVGNQLGWDGQYSYLGNCEDCQNSIVGMFETGVEESEQAIRKSEYEISFEENLVKKKYKYFLENPNDKPYQIYLRLLTDKSSSLSPVNIFTEDAKKQVDPIVYGYDNYKEAGVYVELKAGQTKAVIFEWEDYVENLKDKKGYVQTIIKQPGIKIFPFKVIVKNEANLNIVMDENTFLTEDGAFVYNTEVVKDFSLPFYWQN